MNRRKEKRFKKATRLLAAFIISLPVLLAGVATHPDSASALSSHADLQSQQPSINYCTQGLRTALDNRVNPNAQDVTNREVLSDYCGSAELRNSALTRQIIDYGCIENPAARELERGFSSCLDPSYIEALAAAAQTCRDEITAIVGETQIATWNPGTWRDYCGDYQSINGDITTSIINAGCIENIAARELERGFTACSDDDSDEEDELMPADCIPLDVVPELDVGNAPFCPAEPDPVDPSLPIPVYTGETCYEQVGNPLEVILYRPVLCVEQPDDTPDDPVDSDPDHIPDPATSEPKTPQLKYDDLAVHTFSYLSTRASLFGYSNCPNGGISYGDECGSGSIFNSSVPGDVAGSVAANICMQANTRAQAGKADPDYGMLIDFEGYEGGEAGLVARVEGTELSRFSAEGLWVLGYNGGSIPVNTDGDRVTPVVSGLGDCARTSQDTLVKSASPGSTPSVGLDNLAFNILAEKDAAVAAGNDPPANAIALVRVRTYCPTNVAFVGVDVLKFGKMAEYLNLRNHERFDEIGEALEHDTFRVCVFDRVLLENHLRGLGKSDADVVADLARFDELVYGRPTYVYLEDDSDVAPDPPEREVVNSCDHPASRNFGSKDYYISAIDTNLVGYEGDTVNIPLRLWRKDPSVASTGVAPIKYFWIGRLNDHPFGVTATAERQTGSNPSDSADFGGSGGNGKGKSVGNFDSSFNFSDDSWVNGDGELDPNGCLHQTDISIPTHIWENDVGDNGEDETYQFRLRPNDSWNSATYGNTSSIITIKDGARPPSSSCDHSAYGRNFRGIGRYARPYDYGYNSVDRHLEGYEGETLYPTLELWRRDSSVPSDGVVEIRAGWIYSANQDWYAYYQFNAMGQSNPTPLSSDDFGAGGDDGKGVVDRDVFITTINLDSDRWVNEDGEVDPYGCLYQDTISFPTHLYENSVGDNGEDEQYIFWLLSSDNARLVDGGDQTTLTIKDGLPLSSSCIHPASRDFDGKDYLVSVVDTALEGYENDTLSVRFRMWRRDPSVSASGRFRYGFSWIDVEAEGQRGDNPIPSSDYGGSSMGGKGRASHNAGSAINYVATGWVNDEGEPDPDGCAYDRVFVLPTHLWWNEDDNRDDETYQFRLNVLSGNDASAVDDNDTTTITIFDVDTSRASDFTTRDEVSVNVAESVRTGAATRVEFLANDQCRVASGSANGCTGSRPTIHTQPSEGTASIVAGGLGGWQLEYRPFAWASDQDVVEYIAEVDGSDYSEIISIRFNDSPPEINLNNAVAARSVVHPTRRVLVHPDPHIVPTNHYG